MIHNRQKALIHIYADAARLTEPAYRELLHSSAGVNSAASPRLNQGGFDRLMAALETVLFERVDTGQVHDPVGTSRWIHDRWHWRHRLAPSACISSRQAELVRSLWTRLQALLPPQQRQLSYLAGIIHHATGKRDVGYSALTNTEASHLIDALRDRLAYCLKGDASELSFP